VEFSVTGQYLVLDRPRQLSFSWSCTTWPHPSIRSVVNVLLEPRENEQTLMTIEHSLLPPELVDQHEHGWTAIAQQLAEELAATAPGTRISGSRDRVVGRWSMCAGRRR
jgi:uncharacterized protein YndB with AHSA1/START domain